MTAIWMLIDTRDRQVAGMHATTRIAGLSLIARHVRMAARQGWRGAVVRVAGSEAERAFVRALERQPPPPGFVVEYAAGEQDAPADRVYVPVALHALYAPEALAQAARSGEVSAPLPAPLPTPLPTPLIDIVTPADVRAAERLLYQRIRKSMDQDGVLAYYLFRPLSRRMTRVLVNTPVSPNQVTLTAMAAGIGAAICAGFGGAALVALAGALYWLGSVIDCVDGELARLRLQGSKLGEWLDTLTDDVSTFGLLAGLGIGMMRDGHDDVWMTAAIAAALAGMLVHIKLYADLYRMGRAIDTAQYPWFFGAPFDGGERQRGLGARLFHAISFLFRRDAYVTATAILLIVGLRPVAVLVLGVGVALIVIMFIIHHVLLAVRGATRPGISGSSGEDSAS
jgi:phosphatidylglycerophosphate synthase